MSRIFHIILPLLLSLIPLHTTHASTIADLPNTLEQLSSDNTETVIQALDTLGRICDESCVPYVADMLHHHQLEVVAAACKTASELATPEFSSSLLDIVKNNPSEAVRFEAIKALTAIGAAYDALLLNVNPEHPDEIQRRIVRSLPEHLLKARASQFAQYSGYHELSTSVAKAYQTAPALLLSEIFTAIPSASSDRKRNMLRTIRMLVESSHGKGLTEEEASIFNDDPLDNLELIAQIQAERSTPDAVRWLLAWFNQLPQSALLDIFSRIHDEGAAQLSDAILRTMPPDTARIFDTNPRLKNAFLAQLPPSSASKAYAESLLDIPEYHLNALRLLAQTQDNNAQIIAELGNSNPTQSVAVMHILADNEQNIPKLIELSTNNSITDSLNRTFLARWALVVLLSHTPNAILSDEEKTKLRITSLHILENPRSLNAEPAFWLLTLLGDSPQPPSVEIFTRIRPEMKRAWLHTLNEDTALPYIQIALDDTDDAVVTQALEYLISHPELAKQIPTLENKLIQWVESDIPILNIQASATVAKLGFTSSIPTLQTALTSPDTLIAYNALWALQKLHALPNAHWLKSLYYRAPEGVLRDRLGFLSGLNPGSSENLPMSELESLTPLIPNQIIHLTSQEEPLANRDIAIILEDQSLRLKRTNSFGMLIL